MELVEGKTILLGMSADELQGLVATFGMPRFVGRQIAKWLYQKQVSSFDEMTDVSLKNRSLLGEHCIIGRSAPTERLTSTDGTEKYMFQTLAGGYVETVMIPDHERATLCVSCQVGCKMNCVFCQTGKQGFHGNLLAADILNQIFSVNGLHASNGEFLTNIVYMGQGEPMDNLDAVLQSINILLADYGWAWSPKRITVSTCGLRSGMRRYLEESQCHLAISLHSPIPEQRLQLMPSEKAYGIEQIVRELKHYFPRNGRDVKQRRLSFEYTVFSGLNDTSLHLKELVRLLSPLDCRLNLIRWHKIPDVSLPPTDESRLEMMRDYLISHGIFTTIRASRGEDIMAACGLLSTLHKSNE